MKNFKFIYAAIAVLAVAIIHFTVDTSSAMALSMATGIAIADGETKDEKPTKKEQKLFKQLDKHMGELVKAATNGLVKSEYVDEKHEEIVAQLKKMKKKTKSMNFEKAIDDFKSQIQAEVDQAGVQIAEAAKNIKGAEGKTVYSIMKEALEGDKMVKYLKAGGKGNSEPVVIDMKAVVDVTGFVGAVITPNRVGPQVSFVPPKKFDIRDVMATGTSDSDSIDHIKETGLVDADGFLAENVASAESELNLEEETTTGKRIATHINVSKRALRNVSFLASHLSNRFRELIAVTITGSILNDTGAGNTFNGFFNNAATFTAGDLTGKVDDANRADVLAAAMARLNEITNIEANAIFINPLDEYLLTATKDTTGQYAESTVVVSRIDGRLHINGIPVWSTHHVTFDKYLVCDLSATTTEYLETQPLTMFVAEQHASNAIENQVTFVFETEAILPIYKTFAFLKGTLTTDAIALNV